MKKLYCTKHDRPHDETEHCADACVAVYLASEVDARIGELEKEAAIAVAVWGHIDRMNDVCPKVDPAEKILADFVKAVMPAIEDALPKRRL